jgi:hypothetical protein
MSKLVGCAYGDQWLAEVGWQGERESTSMECSSFRGLRNEESMLEQVARLLESGSELAGWPEDVRTALALALDDG